MGPTRPQTRPYGKAMTRPGFRPRFFASSVLVAIFTALLCALVPAGLPSSTSIGSAFSPSTTLVSLKAPASARVVVAGSAEDPGRRGEPAFLDLAALLPAALVLLGALAGIAAPAGFLHRRTAAVRGPRSAGYPRAPPTA